MKQIEKVSTSSSLSEGDVELVLNDSGRASSL